MAPEGGGQEESTPFHRLEYRRTWRREEKEEEEEMEGEEYM